jgi:hypothetical protein
MSGLHYLQMSKQNEQKEREIIHTVRRAGLKPRRSFSYTTITKNLFVLTVLSLVAQCKMNYWWLVTWLDLLLLLVLLNFLRHNQSEGERKYKHRPPHPYFFSSLPGWLRTDYVILQQKYRERENTSTKRRRTQSQSVRCLQIFFFRITLHGSAMRFEAFVFIWRSKQAR